LVLGDRFVVYGNGFEPDALGYIDDWFCHDAAELVWQCDSLRWEFPDIPLSQVAGAMAMRITIQTGSALRIYLTRLEHIHEVAWGGNPDKPVEYHDGQLGIAPRRSFEKWLEKRMGYCRPWENESRLLLHKLRDLLQSFYV
jgi:light-regulated signal transduction histidine kinase (bacteriophytochrome)